MSALTSTDCLIILSHCPAVSVYSFHYPFFFFFFFFNDTATTEIYTLSLHDALPIYARDVPPLADGRQPRRAGSGGDRRGPDRKSTRLNSSHPSISYAVFCLKKKKRKT